MTRLRMTGLAVAAALWLPNQPAAAGNSQAMATVVLQGLDKVTARVERIEAPVGAKARFGALEIQVRACRKSPPEDPPENAAFLEIWELKTGEAAVSLFKGWMFGSSPALSALEHPVYDVWVLDCK
jgi:hypothetical protein